MDRSRAVILLNDINNIIYDVTGAKATIGMDIRLAPMRVHSLLC